MKRLVLLLLFAIASITQARDYPANCFLVHDGDTVKVTIDLGLGINLTETIRINGIDAPELNTDAGKKSKAFLEKLVEGKNVILKIDDEKPREKYGRILADVLIDNVSISETMIKEKQAKPYDGGKR